MTETTTETDAGGETAEQVADRLETAARTAFRAAARAKHEARDDPYALSISAVGGCTRQAAYRLARTEASDPELAWDTEDLAAYAAAVGGLDAHRRRGFTGRDGLLGTWLHAGLLEHLAAELSSDDGAAVSEVPVRLAVGDWSLSGTLDLYAPGLVVDVKTHGHGYRRKAGEPSRVHRLQVAAYALAAWQAGADVSWIAWLHLDRATGHTTPVVHPFTAELVDEVRARLFAVEDAADDPDATPREADGPGLSAACDTCPWLRRCWGAYAQPGRVGPQGQLAVDDPQVEAALAAYHQATGEETATKKAKDRYRAIFEHDPETGEPRPAGQYGSMRFGYDRRGQRLYVRPAR